MDGELEMTHIHDWLGITMDNKPSTFFFLMALAMSLFERVSASIGIQDFSFFFSVLFYCPSNHRL